MSNITSVGAPEIPGSTSGAVSFARFFEIIRPSDRFCEGRYGDKYLIFGGRTEPFNSGTAFFITGLALYGLLAPQKKPGAVIQFLFSLMFVNGVTSTLSHGSGWYGFGQIDAISIVVMLMLGCSAIVDEIVVENGYICPKACCGWARGRLLLSTAGYLLLATLALFSIGLNASEAVTLSNIFVAVTTAATVIMCIVIVVAVWNVKDETLIKKERLPQVYKRSVMSLMLRTIIPMVLGLISWAIDAFVCPESFPYLHGFWHLLLSYSMLCLITFASYVRADNDADNVEPQIKWRNVFCIGFACCRKGKCGRSKSCWPWPSPDETNENEILGWWALLALPAVDWVQRGTTAVRVRLRRALRSRADKTEFKKAVADFMQMDNPDAFKVRSRPAEVVISFADVDSAQRFKSNFLDPTTARPRRMRQTMEQELISTRVGSLTDTFKQNEALRRFRPKKAVVAPMKIRDFYGTTSDVEEYDDGTSTEEENDSPIELPPRSTRIYSPTSESSSNM